MDSVRKRKVTGENDAANMAVKPSKLLRDGSRKLQRRFLICTGSVFIFIIVFGSYYNALPFNMYTHGTNALDNVALALGLQEHVYAVVIDAGSTGSRVLAFTFHRSLVDGNLKLDDELFVQVKPGLSSFVDNPKEGAEKLQELLDRAKGVIPQADWGRTPLTMKATAGLRLLPQAKADALLQEVRNLFDGSQFLTSENSVSIMDGDDEGLFSWFTVNFLLDCLGGDIKETVAALDLGGGSVQITFAPSVDKTVKDAPAGFIHQVSAFHSDLGVYTHSYLGLGLMAARKGILSAGNPKDAIVLKSQCINPIIKKDWSYGGKTYSVMGPETPTYENIKGGKGSVPEKRPVVNFAECTKAVRQYVHNKADKPAELNGRKINAFSYFFDRATEVGLIDPFKGGVLKVGQFFSAAKSVCAIPNADQPFMCLDLTFISVLLEDGFGLKSDTKLNLYKKIDNHELSWALGAAFHVLQNGL